MIENTETLSEKSFAAAYCNVDDRDPRMVLLAVLGCADSWVPDARIIGNVRAGDISRAIRSALLFVVTPHEYASRYEFRADEGDYVPTDGERTMIEDAISGFLGENSIHPHPAAEEIKRLEAALFAKQVEANGYLKAVGKLQRAKSEGEEPAPQAAWYEDSTGCFHMSLDVALIEGNARDNGHESHYLYGEPVAPKARDSAAPINAERHERALPAVWISNADFAEMASGNLNYGQTARLSNFRKGDFTVPLYAVPPAAVQEPVAVKALEWSDPAEPNETCSYNHVIAKAVFVYSIEWKAWKKYDAFTVYRDGEFLDSLATLDDAKAAAQADFESRIRSALSTATPETKP
ncbi:hypothetical protein F3X89_03895 [Rhizobium rhizogenes]|uniref:hypothetical protein n=1 Tax=Rhizobium rhizogenes TaxID=359 RepID=UPI00193D946C|nr:hypothetical protein [Rhizobium rhizogenes]QRM36976.1 hypothetical protein F3X89_03895 [Rhizobium rhizogenes]